MSDTSPPDDAENDSWDDVLELQRKRVVLGKLHNVQQIERNKKQFKDAVSSRMFWLAIIIGIIAYYAKNIYMSVEYHPRMKAWWKSSSEKLSRYSPPQGEVARTANGKLRQTAPKIPPATSPQAKLKVGLHQVCTTCDYPTVASLMNLLVIWTNLDYKGALFLKQAIHYFEVLNSTTRVVYSADGTMAREGYLNFLHYHGAMADYMKNTTDPLDLVYNPDTVPSHNTANFNKEWIKMSWNQSRLNGNIWFHMFPHGKNGMSINEAGDELFDSKLFSEISKVNRDSVSSILLKFSSLVDGGLVRVAKEATDQTETALDLIETFFGAQNMKIAPDCTASAVDGAINGALGMGMVAPGLVGMGIPGVAIAGLSILGAAVGGITGYEASKETCCRSSDPSSDNCNGGSTLEKLIPG